MNRNDLELRISNSLDNSDVDEAFASINMKEEKNFEVILNQGSIYDADVEVVAPFERGAMVSMLEMSTDNVRLINNFLLPRESYSGDEKIYYIPNPVANFSAGALIVKKELAYRIQQQINPQMQSSYSTRLREIIIKVMEGTVRVVIDGKDHGKKKTREEPYKIVRDSDIIGNCRIVIRNESASVATYELFGTYHAIT